MAKKSLIAREAKRERLMKKFTTKYSELKKQILAPSTTDEKRLEAQINLQAIPKNALQVRRQRRCQICGRPHAVYRKFGLCRIHLREALMNGDVPGGRKSSW